MPQEPDQIVRKQIVNQLGDDVIIQSDQLTENQYMLGNDISYMAYKDLGDGNIDILERFNYDPKKIQESEAKAQEVKQKKVIDDAIKAREEIEAKKARIKTDSAKARGRIKSLHAKIKAEKYEMSMVNYL